MSALSIQPPFPIFTDTDGSPLENGYIWLGTANLNPQTSPITAYWDAALTIPAAQPIRTLGGYPSNAGTPARLYVDVTSSYSILVQNKNGSLVYSAPAATEREIANNISYTPGPDSLLTATNVQAALDQLSDDEDGSSYVGFLQAGAGAVPRTAQSKMRDVVSVKDFGAIEGDASANGAANATAFANAVAASVGKVLLIPSGIWWIDGELVLPEKTKLVGQGMTSTILKHNGAGVFIKTPATFPAYTSNVCISDIMVYGNASTTTGIDLTNTSDASIRDVKVMNCTTGVYCEYGWDNQLEFVHCVLNRGDGFYFNYEANQITLVACASYSNNGSGLVAYQCRMVACYGCTFETNAAYGVYVTSSTSIAAGSRSTLLSGCYIEGNSTFEVLLQNGGGGADPSSVSIDACYFVCMAGKAQTAIRVVDADGVNIQNCNFDTGTATYLYSAFASGGSNVVFGVNTDFSTNKSVIQTKEKEARAKAWANFGGKTTVTINESYNVSSIVRNSAGNYTVTLSNAMPSSYFAVVATSEDGSSYASQYASVAFNTSTQFNILVAESGVLVDGRTISFVVF
jgi:hypothetical protein